MQAELTMSVDALATDDRNDAGVSIETAIYAVLAVFTAVRNLLGLGRAPLGPSEAADALYAWYTAMNKAELLADMPLPSSGLHNVLLLMSYWMGFDGNWISRFWPAVFGVIVVLSPVALRNYVGRNTSLLAATLLFLSPTVWATSQLVAGDALSIGLLALLAWYLFESDTPNWTIVGVLAGLGLASGPLFLSGLLIGAIGAVASKMPFSALVENGRQLIIPLIVAFLASTSIVLLYQGGLAVGAASVGNWFSAWFGTGNARPWWLVAANLALYEPLLLISGILAAILFWQDRTTVQNGLMSMAAATILMSLLYAGRSSSLTIYAIIPLALLTAMLIMDLLSGEWDEESRLIVPLQMLILLIPLVFAVLNLSNFARDYTPALELSLSWQTAVFAGGGFFIALLMAAMFAFGWNVRDAMISSYMAVAVLLIVQTISAGVSLTQSLDARGLELWFADYTDSQAVLLKDSIDEAARRNTQVPEDTRIQVATNPLHPIAWLLRHYNLEFVGGATPTEDRSLPIAVVPADANNTLLAEQYLGQDFNVVGEMAVAPTHFGEWVRYVLYREMALEPGGKDYRVVPQTQPDYTVWVHPDVHLYQR